MSRVLFISLLCSFLSLLSFTAYADDNPKLPEAVKYSISFDGVEDDNVLQLLESLSQELNPEEKAPRNQGILRQKSREDMTHYLAALYSYGYFETVIDSSLKRGDENEITYTIRQGPKYKAGTKRFEFINDKPADLKLPELDELDPLDPKFETVEEINDGAREAEKFIGLNNCLISVEVVGSIQIDKQNSIADIVYETTLGAKADFGDITISGHEEVNEEYIRKLLPIKTGQCFRTSYIEIARTALINSNLFATAEIEHGQTPDSNGQVPLNITLKEKHARTVKAGVSYMTDEGPGVSVGWEHRNYFGGGEKVEAKALVSQLETSIGANYTEPFFYRDDQSLKIGAKAGQESPDAYTSTNIEVTAQVERRLSSKLTAGLGAGYRVSNVEETSTGEKETYGLVYAPAFIQWDGRDNVLNPTGGIFARADSAPYFDTLGSDAYFIRSKGVGSTYFALPVFEEGMKPVIALRGAISSINAAETQSVPADLRFYAGGGSSVRGYAYEDLGPRRNDEPYGGRSLLEFSTELRFNATETIGGVIFVDAGNSFDEVYPSFEEPLQFGAGVGLRYFTDFGPMRLDVALPVNKREGDDAFQLYVSLGQAF